MLFTSILLFLLAISVHELGHAFAMRRYQIPLKQISIFGFGRVLFSFHLKRIFKEVPLQVRLIPVGAFVEPTMRGAIRIKELPYRDKVHVYGAGIAANFLFGGLCGIIGLWLDVPGDSHKVIIMIFCSIVTILGIFPRFTSLLIVPFGLLCLIFLVLGLSQLPVEEVKNSTGGPVLIVQYIGGHAHSWSEVFKTAAFLSINLAVINALPLGPVLDGGKIFSETLKRLFPRLGATTITVIEVVTLLPLLVIIFFSLYFDGLRLIDLVP